MGEKTKITRRVDWLEPWHVNPSANKAYDFIDGLRGIAILMVVAYHLAYVDPQAGGLVRFLGGMLGCGRYGVTVFFALSGFLISWPFWKLKVKSTSQVIPRGYGWRRFWKIYPPVALSVVVFTPVYVLAYHSPEIFKLALQWLVAWPLVAPVNGLMNPAMWSLVVEVHFYLLLPLLFLGFKRLPARPALYAMFLVFMIVPTAFRWFQASHGLYFTLHPELNVRFPSLLDAFAFGILLAGLENLGLLRKSWASLGDVGIILLAGTVLGCAWLNTNQRLDSHLAEEEVGWMVKIAAALLLCYVADPSHPRVRLLSIPWLRWCGIISYEWYLFHQPIAVWARMAYGPRRGDPLLTAGFKYGGTLVGSLVLSLAIASLVYKFFSLPLLRRGREKHSANPLPTGIETSKPQREALGSPH